jgi:rhamnosyltransferase
MTIGVAILTLNAGRDLPRLLPTLVAEPGVDRIIVVDSASTDETEKIVSAYPAVEWVTIRRADFNHGATREMARKHLGTDVVVFLTQDVIPLPGFVVKLVEPIVKGQAVVAYGRQLPHAGAGFLEAFPRAFHYPARSQRRTIEDTARLGIFTFFCSDSFSAYSNQALDAVGGIKPILTNEDYFAVAALLKNGGAIFYQAEAVVHHSHSYTLKQEFQRYFDTGYVRGENPWVNKLVGHVEGHGAGFIKSLVKTLLREKPGLLPYAILQTGIKWLGYRAGGVGPRLPLKWCKRFSSQRYYWTSRYCTRG